MSALMIGLLARALPARIGCNNFATPDCLIRQQIGFVQALEVWLICLPENDRQGQSAAGEKIG